MFITEIVVTLFGSPGKIQLFIIFYETTSPFM